MAFINQDVVEVASELGLIRLRKNSKYFLLEEEWIDLSDVKPDKLDIMTRVVETLLNRLAEERSYCC